MSKSLSLGGETMGAIYFLLPDPLHLPEEQNSLEGAPFLGVGPRALDRGKFSILQSHGISESRGEVGTGPLLDRGGSGESG